jgi:rubrerythrin
MEQRQLNELLLQSLEQELGGVQVYQAAIRCAANDELKEEWEKYLDQTEHHVEILQGVFAQMQLDPEQQSPGRMIVHNLGAALVAAMEAALGAGDPAAAQLVAAECVTLAETKDHMDWELLGEASKKLAGPQRKAHEEACDEVEDQEDEHLYHTRGWARELWMEALGLKAVLPPPDERKDVKTAIGAARAQKERGAMT